MAKSRPEALPLAPLPDLLKWWRGQRVKGVVIGGLAVSLMARPRVTRDVDALVLAPDTQWPRFLKAGSRCGFVPRIDDALGFAVESRALLLRHKPSAIDVDISLGSLPFEFEAVARAVPTRLGRITVPLPTPEDLIIMKAVAHRDRDLLDLQGILAAFPKIDFRRVLRVVGQFSEALDMPEILGDLQAMLQRRRSKKDSDPGCSERTDA